MIRQLPATVIAAALVVSGCSSKPEQPAPPGPKTTTVAISYDDLLSQKNIRREVPLAIGDTLQISLGSNASTGYHWTPDLRISNATVLAQTGHEVIAPQASQPGAPGSEVWALQAVGKGATTVTATYGQPWPGGEKDAWTFTADVTVN